MSLRTMSLKRARRVRGRGGKRVPRNGRPIRWRRETRRWTDPATGWHYVYVQGFIA